MNFQARVVAVSLLGLVLSRAVAHGQFLPAPPDTGATRVRVGPFWLKPTISLANVGVDTNLFNDAAVADPRRDIALAFVPQTDVWMRMGRTWMTGNVRQDLVFFREYRDQRSANGSYRGGWYVPLTRVSVLAEGGYVRTRERPNYEIDLRAPRRERQGGVTAEVRALSRTYVGARVERRRVEYTGSELFAGQNLREELDRTRTVGAATIRHAVTPMTSLSIEASLSRDRFAYAPTRDADASQVLVGLRFDPTALIKGHVLAGYQRFVWSSPDISDYSGPTMSASLSYVASTSTRMTLDALRDVEPSFDPGRPYYVQSGASATVTQRVFGPFDVQARTGVRLLDYRGRVGTAAAASNRRDRVTVIGGGFGYHLGRSTRIAADIETQRRTSPLLLRTYQGERFGVSVTWTP